MSFKPLDRTEVRRGRYLIAGGPNTRKTSALMTTPATAEKPRAILSMPGEKGYATIPLGDALTRAVVWESEPVIDPKTGDTVKPDSSMIVRAVYNESMRLITSGITTFCGDGVHKLYDYILDDVTGGAFFAGMEFDSKLYGAASRAFHDYLNRVMHSGVPVVVFTTWDNYEADRQKRKNEDGRDIPQHIYPDLPGRAAKRILGEFDAVFHQTVAKLKPTDAEEIGRWQTRPYGEVWGCGIKAPAAIVKNIPTYIPADFAYYEAMYTHFEKEAAKTKESQTA